MKIEQIRKDLFDLKKKFGVLLYGSRVSGGARPESDYDIDYFPKS